MMIEGLLSALVLAGLALGLAPERRLETEVEIEAAPDQVWAVLTDAAGHAAWNPFMTALSGAFQPGARLSITMRPAGGRAMVFGPEVLVARPGAELRWLGRLGLPRLFDGEHYFLLERRGATTRLVQGERFRGVLLWGLNPKRFRRDFEAMNRALKAEVERGAARARG